MNPTHLVSPRRLAVLIAVSALGYFVDVFDLLLFSVVRKQSLLGLGVPEPDTLSIGIRLLNWQMGGLLIGGFVWGIIGDKRGRLSVLFGSIGLYSVANLANGFINAVWQYEALRFLAGLGLAGELGAGVTLVSESMSARYRGLGTMLVACVGLAGAVVAGYVGSVYDWRTCYIIGGVMGFVLLFMRVGLYESGLYTSLRNTTAARGSLVLLFRSPERIRRFVKCVLVGLPTYFIIGILITLTPEFGAAFGLAPIPVAGRAISICYTGLVGGNLLCSGLSQILQSRRLAFLIFHLVGLGGSSFSSSCRRQGSRDSMSAVSCWAAAWDIGR
ncbi:MAG: naiP [Pedosphaera sp.]|nr:naiP [Pedosphaera sp.]